MFIQNVHFLYHAIHTKNINVQNFNVETKFELQKYFTSFIWPQIHYSTPSNKKACTIFFRIKGVGGGGNRELYMIMLK